MSRNTAEKNSSVEDVFTYQAALPTLLEMASYRVCIVIWNKYISSFEPNNFNKRKIPAIKCCDEQEGDICNLALGLECGYWNETIVWATSLGVPTSVSKLIEECCDRVMAETRRWLSYFRDEIMHCVALQPYLIRHFDPEWCVWSPNGKIDYTKTAAKMATSTGSSKTNKRGLTNAQKFAIMSNYCMESEIKAFPPPPKNFVQAVSFDEDPLIFYWNCYRRNVLHNVPLENPNHSIDFAMALECCDCQQTWTAFEYFWNRLNAEDRVVVAKQRLLLSPFGEDQTLVLSKMSWSQQHRLLLEIPADIITNFLLHLNLPQAALWAWNHTKHLLTAEQFATIVTLVFKWEFIDDVDETYSSLMDMWDTAPDRLKRRVAEIEDIDMADIFAEYSCTASPNAKKLLLKIFSTKNADSRRDFILGNVFKFFTKIEDFKFTNDVIDLCLPSPEDRLKLKNFLLTDSKKINERCDELLQNRDFDKLSSFVEFCSPDVDFALKFKKRLLNSIKISQQLLFGDFEKWVKLSNFIDECFPNDQLLALSFKKGLITPYIRNFRYDWRETVDLTDNMIEVVESVFQNEELENTKRILSISFSKVLTDREHFRSFLFDKFYKFVSWCFSYDKRRFLQFKNAVLVDSVFDQCLHQMNVDYRASFFGISLKRNFLLLENFLMWIFSDTEKVKDYKLRRINSLDDLELLSTLSARGDETNLEVFLKWFFQR